MQMLATELFPAAIPAGDLRQTWKGSAEFVNDEQLGFMRFRLDRWWGAGPRALICMCNSSTAGGDKNDPTVGRCIELVPPEVDGFSIVNWEPYIASKPGDLYAWRDKASRDHHDAYYALRTRNLALIRELSAAAAVRFVAWGNLVPHVPLTTAVLNAMSLDMMHPLYAFGLTKDGAPKHPMARGTHRIPRGASPVIWQPARSSAVATTKD